MKKRNNGHSPNFAFANLVKLPECEKEADTIVQCLIEGDKDGHYARKYGAKPVERREEAA